MGRDSRPNILIVCTDQQHWRMNSVNGHPLAHTPNLERLAAAGTNFRCCYSNSPVCVPARAAMLTGRYPSDLEAYDNASPFDGRVPTFANLAREAGYFCTASGKLDLVEGRDYGFVEVETRHGHDVSPDVTAFFRNPLCVKPAPRQKTVVREGPPKDRRFLEPTLEFLTREAPRSRRPWLAWTGWNAPHNAYVTSPEMLRKYAPEAMEAPRFPDGWETREHPVMRLTRYHRGLVPPFDEATVRLYRAAYLGMITEIDAMVGDLLDALEATGQARDTVVIFTSDHGDMMGEHGLFQKNAPYDGCARVPLIIAGPGFPAGKTVETPVSLTDLFATIVEVTAAREPEGTRGRSLVPLAHGRENGRGPVFVELNTERLITGVFSLVEWPWKLNLYVDYPAQLFNLAEDPEEWVDRADSPECAAVRQSMERTLRLIVDPEAVNDAAFAEQERRLDAFLRGRTLAQATGEPGFFEHFSRRLGDEQAKSLLARHFQRRT